MTFSGIPSVPFPSPPINYCAVITAGRVLWTKRRRLPPAASPWPGGRPSRHGDADSFPSWPSGGQQWRMKRSQTDSPITKEVGSEIFPRYPKRDDSSSSRRFCGWVAGPYRLPNLGEKPRKNSKKNPDCLTFPLIILLLVWIFFFEKFHIRSICSFNRDFILYKCLEFLALAPRHVRRPERNPETKSKKNTNCLSSSVDFRFFGKDSIRSKCRFDECDALVVVQPWRSV